MTIKQLIIALKAFNPNLEVHMLSDEEGNDRHELQIVGWEGQNDDPRSAHVIVLVPHHGTAESFIA